MPPEPVGLPIIGNLLYIGPKPHESLAKLAQKHGPFMTIRLGSITSVVASTPDDAREILQRNDEACSGRLVPDAIVGLKNPCASILWMPPNEMWRTIRKALNLYLTNQQKLDTLDYLCQNVVAEMLEFLREYGRKRAVVDIGKLGFAGALNQMSNTLLSQNVTSYGSEEDTREFKKPVEAANNIHVLKPLDPQNIRRQSPDEDGF